MHELGYVEGQTIAIDWRFADDSDARLAQFAAELAGVPVDVIFAADSRSIPAAKQATGTVPIVFGVSGDPVGAGLVESLARPGGNITGLSALAEPLAQMPREPFRRQPGTDKRLRQTNLTDCLAMPARALRVSYIPR